MHLNDGFDRTFQYLWLSATEVRNFRCSYCLPDGYKKCLGPQLLNIDDLRRVSAAFSELGIPMRALSQSGDQISKLKLRLLRAVKPIVAIWPSRTWARCSTFPPLGE